MADRRTLNPLSIVSVTLAAGVKYSLTRSCSTLAPRPQILLIQGSEFCLLGGFRKPIGSFLLALESGEECSFLVGFEGERWRVWLDSSYL